MKEEEAAAGGGEERTALAAASLLQTFKTFSMKEKSQASLVNRPCNE